MSNTGKNQLQRISGLHSSIEKNQEVQNEAVSMLCNNLFEHGNIAIVYGAAMGDEGKGKVATVVENLKDLARVVASTGGGNAGHTVYFKGKKIALHELPGGATIEHANVYLGQGRVIHIQGLQKEIDELQKIGVRTKGRIYIAGGAHVVFNSIQKALDAAIEEIKGKHAVGTTKAGIGPSYALKALRTSLTVNDIIHNIPGSIERLKTNLALFGCINQPSIEKECLEELQTIREILLSSDAIKVDTYNTILRDEVSAGKKVLVECSQSALLAIDGGFYPNVTSSDTSPNGIRSGLNIPMGNHTNVAVLKSIKSKVGNGPFPTKILDAELAERYRKATGEFGATTGRNRDIGRFDTIETRKVLTSHPSNIIVLTRLDDLHHMGKVKFATAYNIPQLHKTFTTHTPLEHEYSDVQVQYSREYDVSDKITGIKNFSDLPNDYKNYVKDIMDTLAFQGNVYLGTGPHANDIIHYKSN